MPPGPGTLDYYKTLDEEPDTVFKVSEYVDKVKINGKSKTYGFKNLIYSMLAGKYP
jgi:hypothetical protein